MKQGDGMQKMFILTAALLLAVCALRVRAQETKTFHGEISDSQCALNVHSLTRSHEEMLKSKSMGGTPTDCTLYCVNYHGGDFVLSSKKDVLRLDDQKSARVFAGKKVKIVGTMDADKKTIHILKIGLEQ
jgi:hypothetical protein